VACLVISDLTTNLASEFRAEPDGVLEGFETSIDLASMGAVQKLTYATKTGVRRHRPPPARG